MWIYSLELRKWWIIYVELDLQSVLFFIQASFAETDGEGSCESSPSRDMTTYSQHCFDGRGDGFSLSIIEVPILALITCKESD